MHRILGDKFVAIKKSSPQAYGQKKTKKKKAVSAILIGPPTIGHSPFGGLPKYAIVPAES